MRSTPAALACIAALSLTTAALAAEHPRLLIAFEDVPRLRHICGVGAPAPIEAGYGKFGRLSEDYLALKRHFVKHAGGSPLPGELVAAAFLHLVEPEAPEDADRLLWINGALASPDWTLADPIEYAIVLDWCWYDLNFDIRHYFFRDARSRAVALRPGDSPLSHNAFRERLFSVALATAVDDIDDLSVAWRTTREEILDGVKKYVDQSLPNYLAWRTPTPTSPEAAALEEADTALFLDFASTLLQRDLWREHADQLGRWMDHYVFAAAVLPDGAPQFARDDGCDAPLHPMPQRNQLMPLTARLFAARTNAPTAYVVADTVDNLLRNPNLELAAQWRWVMIAADRADAPRADVAKLPAARDLGGALLLRSGDAANPAAVWVDAAPAQLALGQHADAGHFLLYRKGYLTTDAGPDVAAQAVARKGGSQHLGFSRQPFDFDQFRVAPIAHSCLVFQDPAWQETWRGMPFLPAGGQRLIESTCDDFTGPLQVSPRRRTRLLSYGSQPGAAYAALDLADAYDPRVVNRCTREFFFIAGRVLVIVDRYEAVQTRATPVVVVQLPSRPRVNGLDLPAEARRRGDTNDGGVWRLGDISQLQWANNASAACLALATPQGAEVRVVGGPAEQLAVPEGPFTGRQYVGGSPESFERLIQPAGVDDVQNAWFRLAAPTAMPPAIANMNHWGRLEVEMPRREGAQMLATVIVVGNPDDVVAANIATAANEDRETLSIAVDLKRQSISLEIPTTDSRGGEITLRGDASLIWRVPDAVIADLPIPTTPAK